MSGAGKDAQQTQKLNMQQGQLSAQYYFPLSTGNLTGEYNVALSIQDTSQQVVLATNNTYH